MNILITQRLEVDKWGKKIDTINHELINFINKLKYTPYLVSNKLLLNQKKKKIVNYLKKLNPDLLIISGGGDIKKKDERYFTELYLIKYSIKKKIPIFGICRGMQMIAHFFNSELKKVDGHVAKRHKIKYKFKNIETTRTVNSFHNFSLQKLPKSFKEIGSSHDGEIEAILNEKLLTCGVMWHPEREKMINKKDIQLIKYLICLSKQKS